jgi:[ribosomal protein S5]-alanine N-acetyltransferase
MQLRPLNITEQRNDAMYGDPECQNLFTIYEDYYKTIGFNPPWIGYLAIRDNLVVGCCSFTGSPKLGKVEIAYFTFKDYEGQGVASFCCRELIRICKLTDPGVIITAKTAPEHNSSTHILERNGFQFSSVVQDADIESAWEWIYQPVSVG